MISPTRRRFLTAVGALAGTATLSGTSLGKHSASNGGSGWAHPRFDAANTGFNPAGTGPQAQTGVVDSRWSRDPSIRPGVTPLVDDENVYFLDPPWVRGLDRQTGEQLWQADVGEGVFPIAVDSATNTLLAVDQEELVITGVDTTNGTLSYAEVMSVPPTTAPVVADGLAYCGVEGGYQARSVSTGQEVWTTELDGAVLIPGAIAEGDLFAITRATRYRIDTSDGSVIWRDDVDNFGDFAPVVSNETMYSLLPLRVRGDPVLSAQDVADGSERWRVDRYTNVTDLAVSDEYLYFGGESESGVGLIAVDAADGSHAWQVGTEHALSAPPVVDSASVYFTTRDGTLLAVDRSDGDYRWHWNLSDGGESGQPVVVGETLFVSGEAGLFAFEPGSAEGDAHSADDAPLVDDDSGTATDIDDEDSEGEAGGDGDAPTDGADGDDGFAPGFEMLTALGALAGASYALKRWHTETTDRPRPR